MTITRGLALGRKEVEASPFWHVAGSGSGLLWREDGALTWGALLTPTHLCSCVGDAQAKHSWHVAFDGCGTD